MDKLTQMQKILETQTGTRTCPICGTPYNPRHPRQMTCGGEDCKKSYHYQRKKERESADPEKARRDNNRYCRKQRKKQRLRRLDERNNIRVAEHWEHHKTFDEKVAEYGDRYGEVQAAKTLESVPKVNKEL